ncbi:hypothetical protein ACHAWF_009641 [Thalassiosira exigua]
MKQSPCSFLGYLTEKFRAKGLKPSNLDPCLFLDKDPMAIVYVDDVLFYSHSENAIDELIVKLKMTKYAFQKKPGLIKLAVEGLGLLTKFTSSLSTSAEQTPLPRNLDEEPATRCFNYVSIIGMLHYLNHTRPDCAIAIHQGARYTFEPKRYHEAAGKHSDRYLKGTMNQGLTLDPSDDLTINCFPDADFVGLWGHEYPQGSHCAPSCTGYIIILAGCPILWKSKLQT